MLKKNDYYKENDSIYRVVGSDEKRFLVLNCSACTMPKWVEIEAADAGSLISEEEALLSLGIESIEKSELSSEQKKIVHERYTMIAGILCFLEDDRLRSHAIRKAVETTGKSRRTITNYLCRYLTTGSITSLLDKLPSETKELTADQKNMRWALNKFYYTRQKNKLTDCYVMMLKEKYTDEEGKLKEEHPTIYQFRYFFNKTRKKQTEIISREGMKNYQLNYRPLLGDNVQEFAPAVGMGMVDGTICDIYLVDDSGKLLGRPIFVACVDAYSSLCMGYALLWESGIYSCRELLLNVITDKVEWCRKFGIVIKEEDWNCHQLPGVIVSDRGSEYISYNFEQLTELGIKVISLPSFSANQKGPVEKLFSLVQDSFKPYLKGKGVVEPDIGLRGVRDYRRDACLTIEQFEKILILSILYYNRSRILDNFPFTKAMMQENISPYASAIWNYSCNKTGANLISVSQERLMLVLLPRTTGRFCRHGLRVNGMRYHCDGYVEDYLNGREVQIAYNPDDVTTVYLVEDDYVAFSLLERRFSEKSLEEVQNQQKELREYTRNYMEENLRAKVALAQSIEAITAECIPCENTEIKGITKRRQAARNSRHRNLIDQVAGAGNAKGGTDNE